MHDNYIPNPYIYYLGSKIESYISPRLYEEGHVYNALENLNSFLTLLINKKQLRILINTIYLLY